MNPIQRGRLEDAARKRRHYVRRKAHALAMGAIGGVIVLIFGFAGPYGIWASWSRPGGFGDFVSSILSLVLFGACIFYGVRLFTVAHRRVRTIAYVPPIHRQIAGLPVGRTLLRGSESPSTFGDLLRPANAGRAESAEELLRSESGTV